MAVCTKAARDVSLVKLGGVAGSAATDARSGGRRHAVSVLRTGRHAARRWTLHVGRAPSKPAVGAPYNGCGVCCSPFPARWGCCCPARRPGTVATLQWTPSNRVPALRRDGQFTGCGAALPARLPAADGAVAGRPAAPDHPRWIAAGAGCDPATWRLETSTMASAQANREPCPPSPNFRCRPWTTCCNLGASRTTALNGLQVEGRAGAPHRDRWVTASRAMIEAAIAADADTLLVHHGLFWRGQDGRVTGWMRQRLAPAAGATSICWPTTCPSMPTRRWATTRNSAACSDCRSRPGSATRTWVFWAGPRTGVLCKVRRRSARISPPLGRPVTVVDPAPRPLQQHRLVHRRAQGFRGGHPGGCGRLPHRRSPSCRPTARETGVAFLACGHHASERYGFRRWVPTWPGAWAWTCLHRHRQPRPETIVVLPLAITLGDPAGIGPEIIAGIPRRAGGGCFVAGDVTSLRRSRCLHRRAGAAGLAGGGAGPSRPKRRAPALHSGLLQVGATRMPPVTLGRVSAGRRAGRRCVAWAADAALRGEIAGLVTAPAEQAGVVGGRPAL